MMENDHNLKNFNHLEHGGCAGREGLDLTATRLISCGRTRMCFEHPYNPELVIKIARPGNPGGNLANLQEWQGYQMLAAEQEDFSFASKCYGFIDTGMGRGLACECIRDATGSVSKSIWDTIIYSLDCDIDDVIENVEQLCFYLQERRVRVFDLNLKNIVLQQSVNKNSRARVVDLKSRSASNELIPLNRYFKYFAKWKLKRRCTQLRQRIREYHGRREELAKLKVDR